MKLSEYLKEKSMGNVKTQEKEVSIEELEGQIEAAKRKIKLETQKRKALKKKEEIEKILANPERVATLKRKLGKDNENVKWEKFDEREGFAELLSTFLSKRVFKSLKEEVNRSLNKFQEVEAGQTTSRTHANLKAYVSKNIGNWACCSFLRLVREYFP